MYLVDNCDALFTLPSGAEVINCVAANRDRRFVVVVTDDTLYFYYTSNHLLLCCFKRPNDELIDRGPYKKLYWRSDSRSICVITSSNYVYVYTIDFSDDIDCFNLHDSSEESMVRQSPEFYLKQRRPTVDVSLSVVAKLENEAKCVISLNDELFICLSDGWIHRLGWNGDVLRDFAINIRNVPFFVDQITAKSPQRILEKISFPTAYVVDCAYCPLVGGICVVLNDGRAALLVSRTVEFRPTETSAVWAVGMKDACCCAVNHEFRLIYFGCKNGDVAGYTINDANGSLVQVMRTRMMIKNGTEYLDRITSVRQIQCLSQVVAVIWNVKPPKEKESGTVDDTISLCSLNLNDINGVSNGVADDYYHNQSETVNGNVAETSSIRTVKSSTTRRSSLASSICPPALAIFSPFGAQWWCSFESCLQTGFNHHKYMYSCMDWSPEGYQLWLGATGLGLLTLNFVRSLSDFFERVVMIGTDRVYLSPSKMHEVGAIAPHFVLDVCKVPHDYISANWPIRYVGLDEECRVLAVAGLRGFCFCTVKNLKWRLFRKESQENDLCLTANIVVYKEFILVAACDARGEANFLYAFNVHEQLDRDLARVVRAVDRILLMNHQNDHLLTFDVTATVRIYALYQKYPMMTSNGVSNGRTSSHQQLQKTSLEINCLAEIRVGELLPDPVCVISIQLSKLCYHSDSAEFCPGFDSLLLNVSGHLFMLSPRRQSGGGSAPSSPPIVADRNSLNGLLDANGSGCGKNTSENGDGEPSFKLHPPTLIASNVERVWMHSRRRDIPHLSRALWINAGCRRMQIWLPLSQQKASTASSIGDEETSRVRNGFCATKSFISKRIMLPIDLNLYALVIDDDCLACAAESFTTAGTTTVVESSGSFYGLANGGDDAASSTSSTTIAPQSCGLVPSSNPSVLVHSLMRTTEVFLHRLLRQLLMRNLGTYALAIASACRSLPYFSHILELLLHDVLEEEATSSEPIPDPLLPTIVSFISEFPEYLQTIVHCARKTELAFWNMLFSASHHPREILRICLEDGDLDTAARCLILLQSMEPAMVSVQFALHLLEEATNKQRWTLARDIVRFMRRIDRADFDNNPEVLRLIRNVVEHNLDMLHEEVTLHDGGGCSVTRQLAINTDK